jgi:uncharacterized glyoxalase superfamily protein PhnB
MTVQLGNAMSSSEFISTVRELIPLLFVDDIEQSLAFYCERLGFELVNKWEPDGKLSWCRIERGGAAVMLQQACTEDGPAAGRGRGVGFFFNCDDVDAAYAQFSANGLKLDPPAVAFYGMKQVFCKDPDGYELCFQSPVESR